MATAAAPVELKYGQLPPDAEQLAFVKQASDRIQRNAFLMNRMFDENNVDEAMNYAGQMLEDMKTNILSPIHYNELYQLVLSNLSTLSINFQDTQFFSQRKVAELYETLQYTPSIVPRLYLLFTEAAAFIKAGHAKASAVMRDLIEMARGVQHPTRALFLRHFLLHILKDVLPDINHTEGGSIEDTLTFILENFKQMNVLWVRLEFSLDTKTSEERKLQRSQLKQLVGSNIQRIAAIRGLDVAHYKEIILPFIVEQINACHESLAQHYIIEIVTQVFPAEFHIETLDVLFSVLQHLEDDVSTLSLVTAIIKRLQAFCASDKSAIQTVRLVAVQIYNLLHAGQAFVLEDTLEMLSNLLNFTLEADAHNFDNVNSILRLVENHIEGIYGNNRLDSVQVSRKLRYFLVTPLREMQDASMIFDLEFFPILVNRMRYNDRKLIALEVCKGFARTEALIDTADKLRLFFSIQQVLLKKPTDFEEDPDGQPISVALSAIARVFHLIKNKKSLDDSFALISSVSTSVQNLESDVKECLYLPLGQAILHIAVDIDNNSNESTTTTVRNVLQHIYLLLTENDPPAIPSFWLFLEASQISDRCATEAITTEFFVNAFRIWKDCMVDGSIRFRMLLAMIRAATGLKMMGATSYSSITSELCTCATGLLMKEQQAEAHLLCAHMFNVKREATNSNNEEEDDDGSAFINPTKVKSCLVRSLKAASQMMDKKDQLPWYYRVLSHAVYFIEKGVDLPAEWFNALTTQIDKEHETLGEDLKTKVSAANRKFYHNVIMHKNKIIKSE